MERNALSVKKNNIKKSAFGAAFARALAHLEPDESLRGPDDMAKKFLPLGYRVQLIFPKIMKSLFERKLPGVYWYLNARVRHIDSILKQTVSEKIEQLVIIAAGSDSRAYRFKDALRGTRIFETDLPRAQSEKKKKLSAIFGKLPGHVTYVPGDLNRNSLEDLLLPAGYSPDKKTFFICEGIFHYLPESTVDSLLEFIACNSSHGSSVVFSYAGSVLKSRTDDAETFLKNSDAISEPCLSSIDESEMELFLARRGLRLVSDVGGRELENLYLKDRNGQIAGNVLQVSRIAHAVVTKKGDES